MSRRLSAEMLTARFVFSPWSFKPSNCFSAARTSKSVSWSMTPNGSASGTKRAGSIAPSDGWVHRASASTPARRPLAISTLGWKTRLSSPRSMASCSSVARSESSAEAWVIDHLLAGHRRHQLLEADGLVQRLGHAQAHRRAEPHRRLQHARVEAADQDHPGAAFLLGEEAQELDAVAAGQSEVEHDDPRSGIAIAASEVLRR